MDATVTPSASRHDRIVAGSGGHGHQAQVTTDSRLVASDFTHFGALRLALGSCRGRLPVRHHRGDHRSTPARSPVRARAGAVPGHDAARPSRRTSRPPPVSRTQVQLSWDASTDNVGVTAYDIYRDGSLLASIGTAGRLPGPDRSARHHVQLLRGGQGRGRELVTSPATRPR